jgi:hypothetical protein
MQNFLYIVLFSAMVAGCNSNSASTARELETTGKEKRGETDLNITGGVSFDTLGLADFLAFKAARFPDANKEYATISTARKKINVDTLGWAAYKRTRAKTDHQPIEVPTPQQDITMEPKKSNPSRNSTTSKKAKDEQQSVSEVENESADHSAVAEAPETEEKKDVNKRTSNKTKGAIIGAVTGAATGAVVNKKNRKAGGVVGGIIGAATGYGLGRRKDKKDTSAKGEKQTTDKKQY